MENAKISRGGGGMTFLCYQEGIVDKGAEERAEWKLEYVEQTGISQASCFSACF